SYIASTTCSRVLPGSASSQGWWYAARPSIAPSTYARWVVISAQLVMPPLITSSSAGSSALRRYTDSYLSGGISPVVFRRKPLQHGVARVDDKGAAAALRHRADEIAHEIVAFDFVNPDPVFHRDWKSHRVSDRLNAGRNKRGFRHQTGAEGAFLHALARAADVEVDLVVAVGLTELRAFREILRLGTAELQRHGMLFLAECEMPLDVAVDQCAGGDHLGVQASPGADLAHEEPVVPIRPVHHRRHA